MSGLFPQGRPDHFFRLRYSGRFKGYHANVRRTGSLVVFGLSKNWRRVDHAIQVGLLQDLLARLLKLKARTLQMDLYDSFLKSVHVAVPKSRVDPLLGEAFSRLNDRFFAGLLDSPNLVWGGHSVRKLGSYDFGTDTVTISQALHPARLGDENLLEYVLYHEMLHKKHKFSSKAGRTCSHTPAFRQEEARFDGAKECERRLTRLPSRRSEAGFRNLLSLVWGGR